MNNIQEKLRIAQFEFESLQHEWDKNREHILQLQQTNKELERHGSELIGRIRALQEIIDGLAPVEPDMEEA